MKNLLAHSLRPFLAAAAVVAGMLIPSVGFAATLNFQGDKDILAIGDTFTVDVRVDSADQGINASQATVKFNQSVLSVDHVDKTGSVFNFWLAEPVADNTAGKVTFIGGSTSGFSGRSLQVLRIVFKAKGTGTTRLVFDDAAVTASDGTGTNILTQTAGLDIKCVSAADLVTLKPVLIKTTPEVAKELPIAPKIQVPLYPDQKKWYNAKQIFSVLWQLPKDIAGVATQVTKNPETDPTKSEGLFDNKNFLPLDDGISYLHVRFKNNVGWGPTTHYRIGIDTVPPAAFTLSSPSGEGTDNPRPKVTFSTTDQLSAIEGYYAHVDSGDPIRTTSGTFDVPTQLPGKHIVTIEARDLAGNKTLASKEYWVKALPSPQILSVSRDVYIGEGGLAISGSSMPSVQVIVSLMNERGDEVAQAKTQSLEDGSWSLSIEQPLKVGSYLVGARIRDMRGASSLSSATTRVTVKERPYMVLFGLEFSYQSLIVTALSIAAFAILLSTLMQLERNRSRRRRLASVAKDVSSRIETLKTKLANLAKRHQELERANGKQVTKGAVQLDVMIGKIEEDMEREKKSISGMIEGVN